MDLTTITTDDFRELFFRDFPYLVTWDSEEIYNQGQRVYYETTKLFYDSLINNNEDYDPEDPEFWLQVPDNIENYVQDRDIEKAFAEATINFNQALWGDDAQIKMGFLYLAAHYLSADLKAAQGGAYGTGMSGLVTSRTVGSVSESYNIPQAYLDDPTLAFYTQSAYGLKYLNLILPKIRGNFVAVRGATQP